MLNGALGSLSKHSKDETTTFPVDVPAAKHRGSEEVGNHSKQVTMAESSSVKTDRHAGRIVEYGVAGFSTDSNKCRSVPPTLSYGTDS
mmetsp:Transcript_31302/g.100395  ORF Transcript_31302/g.100395 Transcript_31302/m.100395 type:complete len:88 (+) Transcript_31302:2697-2960(+)